MIRCSTCQTGVLAPGRTKEHDVGPLFGLDRVLLDQAPALICRNCGHVVLEGEVIEATRRKLAELIVRNGASLTGKEARFLRETMDMTQAQLAERLQIIRGTVTRWEASEDLGPVQSFALRTLAAWALDGERLAHIVSAPNVPHPPISMPGPYRINQSAAVGEKLAALMTEEYLQERGRRASAAKFDAVLAKIPEAPPMQGDELPVGHGARQKKKRKTG